MGCEVGGGQRDRGGKVASMSMSVGVGVVIGAGGGGVVGD